MTETSFVRSQMLPPLAPPVSERGAVKWLRENLFSGWLNSILTVVAECCIDIAVCLRAVGKNFQSVQPVPANLLSKNRRFWPEVAPWSTISRTKKHAE